VEPTLAWVALMGGAQGMSAAAAASAAARASNRCAACT